MDRRKFDPVLAFVSIASVSVIDWSDLGSWNQFQIVSETDWLNLIERTAPAVRNKPDDRKKRIERIANVHFMYCTNFHSRGMIFEFAMAVSSNYLRDCSNYYGLPSLEFPDVLVNRQLRPGKSDVKEVSSAPCLSVRVAYEIDDYEWD